MKCLYCGAPVAASRGLSEPEFCSDDHRFQYQSAIRLRRCESAVPLAGPELAPPNESIPGIGRQLTTGSTAIALPAVRMDVRGLCLTLTRPARLHSLVAVWPFQVQAACSGDSKIRTIPTPASRPRIPGASISPGGSIFALPRFVIWWRRIAVNWRRVPRALQVSMAAIPLVLTAVLHGWPSRPDFGHTGTAVQGLVKTQWAGLGAQVQQRAGVDLAEDFRTGLGEWRGRANSKPAWTFDNAGFAHPGPLALFRPTENLDDYRLEFRAQIDRQGFGFVFRARDFNNYYAVRFVIAEPGPLPRVNIVRYAVIQGREGAHVSRPLTFTVRTDTWYTVRLDVQKKDFTLNIQGNVADCWSDDRLADGGVGFFCGKGEQARLRSVAVSHQNDTLGKVCAYLKPHGERKE